MNPLPFDPTLYNLPMLDLLLLALAKQPFWTGLAIMVAGGTLLTVIGALLVGAAQDPLLMEPGIMEANFLSGAKFGFLGEVFAALLAFVLVDGGVRYTDARQQVQIETSALRLFDTVVTDLSGTKVDTLRRDLRIYATAVAEHEFFTMQIGQESMAARHSFEQVLTSYLRLKNRTEQDRLVRLQADQFLAKVLDSRQRRLQAARPGLRTLIWTVFLGNTLVAIMFSWWFRARSLAAHVTMAMVMTVALMVILHLAVLLYHPFTGDLAISSTPYLSLPAL